MKDRVKGLLAGASLVLTVLVAVAAPAQADFRGPPGGAGDDGPGHEGRGYRGAEPAPGRGSGPHPYRSADVDLWHRGAWWQGRHDGRDGWWWIVGSRWYWYPSPVYPSPSPYTPPLVAAVPSGAAAYYYCASPAGYYPQVAVCSLPWQQVAPQGFPPVQTYGQPYSPSPAEPGSDKTIGGTLLGGVGGAVAGAQFGKGTGQLAATAAGTLLGAFLGHEVGASLDRADFVAARQAEQAARTAAVGQTITWNNPATGTMGSLTPVRDGTDSSGHYCREYQQTVTVGGQPSTAYGTACRQADGSWKIISQN